MTDKILDGAAAQLAQFDLIKGTLPKGIVVNKDDTGDSFDVDSENDSLQTSHQDASDTTKSDSKANNDNHDYKKRYSDTKSAYDKLKEAHKKELDELHKSIEELKTSNIKATMPRTEEEMATFAEKYPNFYKQIEAQARKIVLEQNETLSRQFKEVENKQKEIDAARGYAELSEMGHPDAREIKQDDNFLEWYELQTPTIQALFNTSDVKSLSIGLDRYKEEAGIAKSKPKSNPKKDAAKLVKTGSGADTPPEKRIWHEAEVARMSESEYDRYEKVIDQARKEGRWVPLPK